MRLAHLLPLRAARSAALIPLLLGAVAGTATAGGLRLAVLPFDGPQAQAAQEEIERALAPLAELVPAAATATAIKRHGTKSDPGIAAIAQGLGAQLVIVGRLRQERRLVLVATVRDANGSALRAVEVTMAGSKLEPAGLKRASDQLAATIAALQLALRGPEVAAPAPEPSPSPEPPPPPPPSAAALRSHYLDGSVGLLLTGRRFGFGKNGSLDGLATCQPGPTSCPRYNGAIAAGLRLDLTFYPLRLFNSGHGKWRYLVGLGVGATYDFVGWPGSVDAQAAPGACGGKTSCRFGTREHRLGVGVRYHFRLVDRPWSPLFTAVLQYGFHSFAIDPPADGVTVVPNVGYSFLDLGVGLLVPILGRASIAASIDAYPVVAGGAIQSAKEYGPGGGSGVRGNLAAQARVWRDLSVRLLGFYEVLWLSFDGRGMPPKTTDGGTSDAYWGLVAGAGYVY